MMTPTDASAAAAKRPAWPERDEVVWAAALVACFILLGVIHYCPSYFVGKFTLFQVWVNTFWTDLSNQFAGMFGGKSTGTLGGEASTSQWTHCVAVPFITAWLVWDLWPRLRVARTEGHVHGYALLGAGFFFYIAGFLMENYYVGMAAMELVYAGLIVLFFGWSVMRLLAFPLLFLMFMWPYNFMEDVALSLRLQMSWLGHYVLQLIGVPNVLSGASILSAPGAAHSFGIDIADPCSGIRSLFALVMIGALYAYLAFEKPWQQAVIVALSVPLVILGNLVRIVLLVLGTLHFGADFAIGTDAQPSTFHETAGYLVYMVSLCSLIGAGMWLTRLTSLPKKHARA